MKILAVDIGNTNIVLGVYDGADLVNHWRLATRKRSTPDEYNILIRALFEGSGFNSAQGKPAGLVISCVVPALTRVLLDALRPFHGGYECLVGPGTKTSMKILTDDPREVGADRIVNAVSAYNKFKAAVIVVDFGTATTFDYITARGEYAGGAIAPGIVVSADALFQRAARLPRVEVSRPDCLIGKTTIESIKAGIFYGYESMLEGIVAKMKQEAGAGAKVVATGGFSALIAAHCSCVDEVDEFLTLNGLRLIYGMNC